MQIQKTEREFHFSGLVLPDPSSSLDIEGVRAAYSSSYPELTTAAVSGPEAIGGKLVYTFSKSVGVKG